jgi:hypothetical protein
VSRIQLSSRHFLNLRIADDAARSHAGLGATTALPLAAHAQQVAVPVIRTLNQETLNDASQINAFRKGLAETGFVEGRTVAIEYRLAEDHFTVPTALLKFDGGTTA